MRIALIYNRGNRLPLGEICQDILKKYKTLEIYQFDLKEIQSVKERFDLYLRIGDDNYEILPNDLHPVGWWITDTHLKHAYKKIKKQAKDYDFLFCAQKEGAQKLERDLNKKVYWLPLGTPGVDPNFKFVQEEDKIWDICFVGTQGKYSLRKVVLELIKINYPNSFIGEVPFSKLLEFYSKSKICINYPINNDINARIFEAMSAGSLVITYRIKNNGFEELFEENKHLVVFDDIFEEMKEKIDYYLKNTDARLKIAKNGFEYVNKCHTYTQRLTRMFKIIGIDLQNL